MEQYLHHAGGERPVQPVHGAAHDGAGHYDVLRASLVHRKRASRYVLQNFVYLMELSLRKFVSISMLFHTP